MTALYARLDRASPYVLSILRIITGLLFLQHSLQKYFAFPSAGPHMRPLLYVQGIIEIAGGVLAGGLYTRIVAFILSGDMAFAYFIAHFPRSFIRRSMAETWRCCIASSFSTFSSPAVDLGASIASSQGRIGPIGRLGEPLNEKTGGRIMSSTSGRRHSSVQSTVQVMQSFVRRAHARPAIRNPCPTAVHPLSRGDRQQ